MMSQAYFWILAHGPEIAALLVVVLPSLITGLSNYPRAGSGAIGILKAILALASWVTHRDSPGTFKLPLTLPSRPDSHGYARLTVLAALAFVAAILCAGAARAQEPPSPAPQRLVGGCNAKGTICAGPSIAVTMTAYDLTHKQVVAGFNPGVGYGVTFNQNRWDAFGVDFYVSLQSGVESAVTMAVMAKVANGYLRAGWARQIIAGHGATLIPIGIGLDF